MVHAVTSYRQEYDEKRVERQTRYHHEDQLRTEGEFIGERRADYVATRGERAPVRRPQDNLRLEGEFVGRTREEAPKYGERAPITKPRDNLKSEGQFDSKYLEFELRSHAFSAELRKRIIHLVIVRRSSSTTRIKRSRFCRVSSYNNHRAGLHRCYRRTIEPDTSQHLHEDRG